MNKVQISSSLLGVKYGFYIESERTIYVSPIIGRLIDSDRELMRGQLKVFKMPLKENGANKFETLELWLIDLVGRSYEIFEKEK